MILPYFLSLSFARAHSPLHALSVSMYLYQYYLIDILIHVLNIVANI